ncbi:MAG: hypothetical protein LIO79_06405 [Rikenellaceae bacterium]|nr:hypothetical protein [Rikenellaceae bacterium]
MAATEHDSALIGLNYFPNRSLKFQVNYTYNHVKTRSNYSHLAAQFIALF